MVGNTVLFHISVESPAMRYQCKAKQGLPITCFAFKFPAHRHLGLHDVIWLPNCFTQKMLCFLKMAVHGKWAIILTQFLLLLNVKYFSPSPVKFEI